MESFDKKLEVDTTTLDSTLYNVAIAEKNDTIKELEKENAALKLIISELEEDISDFKSWLPRIRTKEEDDAFKIQYLSPIMHYTDFITVYKIDWLDIDTIKNVAIEIYNLIKE